MKYDNLLPCQNLMAAEKTVYIENGKTFNRFTCKSGNVKVDIAGDEQRILLDVLEKTCRQHCPALNRK